MLLAMYDVVKADADVVCVIHDEICLRHDDFVADKPYPWGRVG